jgi:Ca-activated chloride channel family protein
VNTALLANLAKVSRAVSTYVLPGEDVEQKVSQTYRRLKGPILTNPRLFAIDRDGKESTVLVRETQPNELTDVFEGDQITVLGQYTNPGELRMKLTGEYLGTPREFTFAFKLDGASARHGFVPRLWATRKVGALVDQVRQMGAENTNIANDPRGKELIDEIVRLSMRWGIMTEYTSFLATEPNLALGANGRFDRLAVWNETLGRVNSGNRDRAGLQGVQKDADVKAKGEAQNAQISGGYVYYAESSAPASGGSGLATAATPALRAAGDGVQMVITVQNINSQTYFNRNNRWVDSRVLDKESEKPEVEVVVSTPEFKKIADALAAEGQSGVLALEGEILLLLDGKRVLIKPAA